MSLSTTADRIAAFETIQFDYIRQRLGCVRQGDSPLFEHRNFGGIRAFRMTRAPDWALANTAHGYDPQAFGFAVQWYREFNLSPRFEIAATYLDDADKQALVESGLNYRCTHCALGCAITGIGPPPVPNGLKIQIVDADSLDPFIRTYLDAFQIETDREQARQNLSRWLDLPEQTLVLARIKTLPVGVAVLYQEGDFGYLATAATLPAYRGRGVHAALIGFRAALAREFGAKVLFAASHFGTTGMRNLQSAGLSILYPRLVWTQPPAAPESSD
ncbi:MAG: GNAT family N-acetyltransferase [Opitutales bacterium]